MPKVNALVLCGCAWLAWALYWLVAAAFVNKTKSSEGRLRRLGHVIPLDVGLVLIFHGGSRAWIYGRFYHTGWPAAAGLALTMAGLLFCVWARVHLGKYWSGTITLKEGHELIRSGPYRYVRHPIYTGLLLAAFGSAMTAATGDALIGFAIVLLALLIKARREESMLSKEFGEQYGQFKKEVAALVPLVY